MKKILNIIWIIGTVAIASITIIFKCNYHVDEIYSYVLANNIDSGTLVFEDGIVYDTAGETPWEICMSVSELERFDVENVWLNQKNDVHPPLYYIFLNFFSSLFVGQFSKWFAGIINILFYGLSVWYVYKLAACISKNGG